MDRIVRAFDYLNPILYGTLCWIDALFGYRPGATDEPEVIA